MHPEIAQRFTKANYTFKNWNIPNLLLNNLPLFALHQLLGHLDRPLPHLFCGRFLHSFYHTICLEKVWINTIHIELLISSSFINNPNFNQINIKLSYCFTLFSLLPPTFFWPCFQPPCSHPQWYQLSYSLSVLSDLSYSSHLRTTAIFSSSSVYWHVHLWIHVDFLSKFRACLQILSWYPLLYVPNPLHNLLPHMQLYVKSTPTSCYLKSVLSKF